jgi:hypothetical protein
MVRGWWVVVRLLTSKLGFLPDKPAGERGGAVRREEAVSGSAAVGVWCPY